MIYLYILLGIILYVAYSITMLVYCLGRKTQSNKWYDYILIPPIMPIAYLIGLIVKRAEIRYAKKLKDVGR